MSPPCLRKRKSCTLPSTNHINYSITTSEYPKPDGWLLESVTPLLVEPPSGSGVAVEVQPPPLLGHNLKHQL